MGENINKAVESKREKITRANSAVFIAVTIASVMVVFSVISVRFLWNQMGYNDRVIGKKVEARKQIEDNINNLAQLEQQFPELQKRKTNNDKTILHALPPNYDYAALVTSMEYLAQQSGVKLSAGIGTDQSASAVGPQNVSQPKEITLTLNVQGNYDSVVRYIDSLEKSIRPILVNSMDFSGSNEDLKAAIQAVTYYQPARTLDISKEAIR